MLEIIGRIQLFDQLFVKDWYGFSLKESFLMPSALTVRI